MNEIERRIRQARRPVALTGAGISAPSGIPTFQGTWKGRPIRDFLSRDYFIKHTEEFFELFVEMESWCDKLPNSAHLALAALDIPVITQNIDGLHEKAGTRELYTMHGTLHTVRCESCGKVQEAAGFAKQLRAFFENRDRAAVQSALRCPVCGGQIDTDIVLYGDAVRFLEEAVLLSEQTDLMLIVGTSLTTYPAASFPEIARRHGAEIIEINDDCISALEGIIR